MLAIISLLLELILLASITSGGTMEISNISASLLILLFSVCLFISVSQNKRLKQLYGQSLCLGYLLRIGILYFDIYGQSIYSLPNMVGDATVFYREAKTRAEAIFTGVTMLPSIRGQYPEMMSRLFSVIGTNRLYGQFLSMLCSIVALVFFGYTLSELDISDETKKKTFLLVCLLPNFAILNTAFLREAIVVMFLSISLYCFVLWTKQHRNHLLLEAMILIFPASYFHSGTVAVLAGYIIILTVYDNKSRKIKIKLTNIIIAAALTLIVTALLSNYADDFLGKFNDLDSIEDIANTHTYGRTSYAQYVGNSSNLSSIVIYTFPRLFFFLLSPLPWMWSSFGDIIAFFFSSLYYLLVIIRTLQFLKLKNTKNRSIVIALGIIALGTTFVFAWGSANAGTAARHRDKMALLYGLLLAMSIDGLKKKHERETY